MRELPITNIGLYSLAPETADIGKDAYSPVCDDYDAWDNAFTGRSIT